MLVNVSSWVRHYKARMLLISQNGMGSNDLEISISKITSVGVAGEVVVKLEGPESGYPIIHS